ncbi:TetR/AcrR family transcriptional regulator [Actinomadura vinacea]
MGQRERLMAAARRLVQEQGYARTTSRDLAAAAEANIASINYHYGSKEELLTAALMETVDSWGDKIVSAPAAAPSGETAAPDAARERLARLWDEVIESFTTERAMIVAAVEAFAQAERLPRVREQLAAAYERSRVPLGRQLQGTRPPTANPQWAAPQGAAPQGAAPQGVQPRKVEPDGTEPHGAEPHGALPHGAEAHGGEPYGAGSDGERTARAVGSVYSALIAGLSLQWLVDPENAPSADEVMLGLQAMVTSVRSTDQSG